MAPSDCVLDCVAPASRISAAKEMTDRMARPLTCGNDFQTSGDGRAPRTVDDAEEEASRRPKTAASLAEFAHDLCSPLSALAITARCLRDEGNLEDQSDNIDAIINISEHVLGIVRDVLDRARVEAGSDISRMTTCDLQLLASSVTDLIRPCARAKNLEFLVHRDPSCPRHVRADFSRLQRILINVLDNAVKYTTQGSVALSLYAAETRDPARIRLIFEIRDTGIGIARKDQARIYERFVRGSGAAGTNGSGLGLTIASQLVDLMDGSIRIESEPGAGSTFHIELPVARALETDNALPPAIRERPNLPLEGLAALPYELRAELRESVLALDVQRISRTIERVAEQNATLGEHLNRMARRYSFTAMLEAVDACNS